MIAMSEKKSVWHAVRARPNMDVRVARELGKLKYEAFLAWTFVRAASAGGKAWPKAELRLSPYVFVLVDYSHQDIRPVLDTNGVEGVVSLRRSIGDPDMHPSEIPEKVIAGLRLDQIEDFESAVRRVRRKESLFEIGQRVRIRDGGPFDGLTGDITETRSHAVIVEIPGGFPLRVEEHELEPVEFQGGARAATRGT